MTNDCAARTFVSAAALVFAALLPCGIAAQSDKSAKKAVETAEGPRRQAFSVVLLLGDMKGGESLDLVPAAARKALSDTKDFLPYKNYRLLDSQWTHCCSGSAAAITRLRGADDQEYELELRANPVFAVRSGGMAFEPGAFSVRFLLRELSESVTTPKAAADRSKEPAGKFSAVAAAEHHQRAAQISEQLFNLEREEFDLTTEAVALRGRVDVGTGDPAKLKRAEGQLSLVRQRIAALKQELSALSVVKSGAKAIIDTSFRMDVGETVVVGTSGLKGGNRALIALLTAVSSSPAKPR